MSRKERVSIVAGVIVLWLFISFGIFPEVAAQQQDSLDVKELKGVVVSESAPKRALRSAMPLQTLDEQGIERLNALQLSDAVKFFSGVMIKDYGGVGGLKTISVRSLGAAHTAVSYDGVAVTDFQTGQVDLGKFSLDNIEKISLAAGQNDDIFQPARLFSSAAVLNIRTSAPAFDETKKINATAGLKAGSFSLWNPRFNVEGKLSEALSVSLNAAYLNTKGNYPYTLYYGSSEHDSSSQERRRNSDVESFHVEANLFGGFKNNANLRVKLYYYQSERGLPGAITFYYDQAHQRLYDQNFFAQAHYRQILNDKLSVQANGKFNWSYQRYRNPDYLGEAGTQENNYYQTEGYLSGTLLYNPWKRLSLSLASDVSYNAMRADLPSFAFPERMTWLTALAVKFTNSFMTASGSLLATVIAEKVSYRKETHQLPSYGAKAPNSQRLSPAASIAFRPFGGEDFTVRLMFKEIFRMPSFNDLYYSRVGNSDLKPEYTWQYDVGIAWGREVAAWIPWLSLVADAYYNKVKNKIMAIPTKNIFEWSMQNIGKVDVYGVDLTLECRFKAAEAYLFSLAGTYTFQKAWDVTSATDPIYKKVYKHQIPYTPEHSASGRFSFENPYVNLAYTILYAGTRYSLGQNVSENRLPAYTDQSVSLSREFVLGKISLLGNVEILNLFNHQYEVVRYFPMPGRSCRASLTVKF